MITTTSTAFSLAISPNPNPNPRFLYPNATFLFHSPATNLVFSSPRRRRRSSSSSCCSSLVSLPPPERLQPLDLPLLPFDVAEVLIPSESKTLHLYEARFLALLEESLARRNKSFVHFVLDPVLTRKSSSKTKSTFAARYGCLVHVESVEKLEIGALVTIRGMCRVNIIKLIQMEPYLRGVVLPILDSKPYEGTEIDKRVSQLRESICSLHNLQIKLKVPKEELLQTNVKSSLLWAETENFKDCDVAYVPQLAERLSFAAFQTVSGMSDTEQLDLQKEKLQAMDSRDTLGRLNNGIPFVKHNTNMVAARLAIQNL